MFKILNHYEHNGYQITEYTKDGTAVSHTVKVPIQTEPIEPVEPQPTEQELTQAQILLNTEMLLIYKELGMEMI